MTPETFNRRIGAVVRASRQAMGLRFTALSQSSGVSRGLLSSIENGKGNMTIKTLLRLARALKKSPSQLVKEAE
jgi:transcriptional regulator with XRE-family HTH domain